MSFYVKRYLRVVTREHEDVEAWKKMDHPHVCRLVEYFESPKYLWLVTELCRGQALSSLMLKGLACFRSCVSGSSRPKEACPRLRRAGMSGSPTVSSGLYMLLSSTSRPFQM